MTLSSADLDKALKRTDRVQNAASDPAASVWVSANAGTGKTHVLKMRVLRLLLAGVAPQKILCLTYTKAAASEMAKRVFEDLAKWVTEPKDELAKALAVLLARAPTGEELARARMLFASAIETPGGFKVQTIHAFAERLLQRFPLEAGVTPGFAILDEVDAAELKRQAINDVLAEASNQPKSPLGRALETAIAHAADDRFDEIVTAALSHRAWLEDAIRLPGVTQGLAKAEGMLRTHFSVRDGVTLNKLTDAAANVMSDTECPDIAAVLSRGTKTDIERAEELRAIAKTTAVEARTVLLSEFFLTGDGEPRKSLITKKLADANAPVQAKLQRAQEQFATLWTELKGLEVVEATIALARLADAVLQKYSEAKARRAALDFDDLIARTKNLLATRGSAEWVLYKLDNGLDHLLVDESQDTSPSQWQVVARLAEEFFAGSGTHETPRTIFAVGDEKQSIYSFQGAAPEMFAMMGKRFRDLAHRAQAPFHRVDLDVSFRSTAPVLEVVDRVFGDSLRTPGVPAGADGIRHIAKRLGQAGSVEIWRTEKWAEGGVADPWSPLDETTATAPAVRLAERIAATIRSWLDNKEKLPSAGRPIRAGDILILVRKRRPFAGPMVTALKAKDVPVAGADRLALTQHIAVQDLISLGGFLTLPEDDLALAEVLKSPIFDLDDDDLLRLAPGRKGTLWKALLDSAGADARYKAAVETLKRWRKAADFTPPFEFWANLLDADGVRARLVSRLGPDAIDPLDEFLNVALTYDDGAPASLTGFLHALTEQEREIKRDTEHARDEVRVMTVHGAKGLEAPIVILPDTCATGSAGGGGGLIELEALRRSGDEAAPFVWPIKGSKPLRPIQDARALLQGQEAEERNRLLYVAMTRPRDRLIVAGFESSRGRAKGCWYDTICDALGVSADAVGDDPVLCRSEVVQVDAPDTKPKDTAGDVVAQGLPEWATTAAPREKSLSIPLAPSRLAPYEADDEGEPERAEPAADPLAEPPALPPRGDVKGAGAGLEGDRFLRGTLTHALLEHLPGVEVALRAETAASYLRARAGHLPERTRKSIAREALALLDHAAFGDVFSARSRAEAALVAEIPNPSGRGPALKLTGQIDRLAVTDDAVLIIDYKTNRGAPRDVQSVPPVYLYQLAAYRLALKEIYPNRPVRAALLWTEVPLLMEIPQALLDRYADELWRLDGASLDVKGMRS